MSMFFLSFFKKGLLRPKNKLTQLYFLEPAVPEAQNTSLVSTNIGEPSTQKSLRGSTSFTWVRVPESQKKPDDREKKPKIHKF